MSKKLNMLMILDGYGLGKDNDSNAISLQGSPNMKKLIRDYPSSTLGASGMDVGLPDGQMGNSEVGHLNIGAGRIVYQELTRITKSISDGDFFETPAFLKAVANAKTNGKKLHIMGLLSDGGVHSHLSHVKALMSLAKKEGLNDVYLHALMDGRDVSPTSGADFVKEIFGYTKEISFGKIATICGRYYGMDRDNRWDRVEKAYNLLTKGEGIKTTCPYQTLLESYDKGVTDEFIMPTVVTKENGEPVAKIEKGDSMIFFNFRPDRAREITRALTQENFKEFPVSDLDLTYVCLTRYDATFQNVEIAFAPQTLDNTLGEFLSKNSKTQLRIAETEKYAHVTFFFNGGVEKENAGEERILIPSPKVATYDLQPEMSAPEVCDSVISEIEKERFDAIILNFANCDMVGHTGIMSAAVKAVATVDECVGKIAAAVLGKCGNLLITADHGNADFMTNPDGSPFTAHTTNKVPFVLVSSEFKNAKLENGRLSDIAPTLLDLMNLEKPVEMTGVSLLKK